MNTTQLDYLKILLEEKRYGEALNNIKLVKDQLETMCQKSAEVLAANELEIPRSFLKTKPEHWMFLNETWMKLVNIDGDNIVLEITDGIRIKTRFKTDGK